MGLLDALTGSATDPGALYGSLLTPQQNSALAYRGLLAAAGALGQAAMPSRMPIPIGAALGSAAGAMGTAQDSAGENALKGMLVGLQGQNLASQIGIRNQIPGVLQQLMKGQGGAGASPTGGGEVGSPAPNASVSAPISEGTGGGENWETRHNNFAGMRIPGVIAGPNSGGFQAFDTPEAGIAAISNQLDRYASGATTGKPLTTLNQIISTWAPPSENDTATLINRATKVMGVDANMPLDLSNPSTKAKLVEAMIRNEQGGNLPSTAAAAIPKVFNAPGFTPYGGKPPQYADAGLTANDGSPAPAAPPAAPQSLLPTQAPPAPGGDNLRVGGVLAPQTSMLPPASPQSPAAPAPGGILGPQPPQVAQTAPPTPAPSGAPGMSVGGMGLPQPPNMDPRALAAAGVMGRLGGMGDLFDPLEKYYYQSPGYLAQKAGAESMGAVPAHNLETQFKTNEDIRAAFAKPGELRTNGLAYVPGTGQILARNPQVPMGYTLGGTATNPIVEPVPGALPAITASEQAQHLGEGLGKNQANLSTTNPMGGPAANAQPTPSAYGMLPPLSEQKLPASAAEAEHAIPEFRKKITEWTDAAPAGQQAEMRLLASWKALQAVQSGAWTTEKADLVARLRGAGINLPKDILGANPSDVETVIHEGVLATLPILKASVARPAQSEFNRVVENLQNPDLQPEANQQIMAEGIALARQAQNIPNAFKASQWQDPQGFETSYLAHNNLTNQAAQIKAELGPLKGMAGANSVHPPGGYDYNPTTRSFTPRAQ